MNKQVKRIVYYGNKVLNQPATIIVVLVLLFAYFAAGNAKFQKQNRHILDDTHATVENSQTIIKNLQAAVKDLKDDNARQTRFIECILALHGANVPIDADVQAQCTKMSASVGLEDVTKTQSFPQTPSINQPPATAQNSTPPAQAPPAQPGTVDTIINGLTTGTKQIINSLKDIL